MRRFLISSALVAALAAPAFGAESGAPTPLLTAEDEAPVRLARLVPLASDSAWTPRFAAAADELAAALRSGDEARWAPLLGGRWLAAADRARVAALLGDDKGSFRNILFSKDVMHRSILGWSAPSSLSIDERAAIEAGQEAEALVCWAAGGNGSGPWPVTMAEADNGVGRPYACARITYSIRGEAPTWRAFIEPPPA
ncbi:MULTISPECIES: hypothetical protein [unclassified Sphingopyxis]|jgi:hypothetical protein|uniref:hypothetical protein n=1 Tax=unclassified Sphingopyxis TaxID=2614943 RepID=UPI00285FD69C|nr:MULTISPECIES: hypothetical protein [unclassified Sphingopyxis]MDR6834832.1 hypothetical protein [Sphingopyxis sp. BE122]MDR7227103.1 hypothetical protein [Sphingopyxis sp. BE259]